MELKVEHLAPYLPYGLRLRYTREDSVIPEGIMTGVTTDYTETGTSIVHISRSRPLLRPLRMIDDEITHNGDTFVPIDFIEDKYYSLSLHKECERLLEYEGYRWISHMSYLLVLQLLEWHFDIFGLIDAGLADELT